MSLFKARTLTNKDFIFSKKEVMDEFTREVDDFSVVPCEGNYRMMVYYYSIYSALYLKEVSQSVKPNQKMRDELSLMNSFIVEACTQIGYKYIHKTMGYTIVDKTVGYILDNKLESLFQFIQDTIEDINNSYIEEE